MQFQKVLCLVAVQLTAVISLSVPVTASAAPTPSCSSTYFNARLLSELEAGKTEDLAVCKPSELDALEQQLKDSAQNDYNQMNTREAQFNTEKMRNYRLQRLIDTVSLDRVRAYRSAHNM